ncbi:MAG: 50S ribosomal protein L33 [Patescibacteria group bacterium]|jgi:large subunit ribosomal protein L33
MTKRTDDHYVKMECTVCKNVTYRVRKNRKKIKERLASSKYCRHCRKHTPHKETK